MTSDGYMGLGRGIEGAGIAAVWEQGSTGAGAAYSSGAKSGLRFFLTAELSLATGVS